MSGIPIQNFYFEINNKYHTQWDGFDSAASDAIEINPIHASNSGLRQNMKVILNVKTFADNNNDVEEVYVAPITSDDWEIAETNASFLQDEIMMQTKVVGKGEPLICQIGNVTCHLEVQKIVPESLQVGRLSNGTLVIVEPKVNQNRTQKPDLDSSKLQEDIISTIKRSICWETSGSSEEMSVYVNKNELHSHLGYVSIVPNGIDSSTSMKKHKHANLKYINTHLAVKIKNYEELGFDAVLPDNHIICSRAVWDSLLSPRKNNGMRLKLEFVNSKHNWMVDVAKSSIIIHSQRELNAEMKKDCIKKISEKLVLTNYMFMRDQNILLELIDPEGKHRRAVDITLSEPQWSFKILEQKDLPEAMASNHNKNTFTPTNEIINELTAYLTASITPSVGVLIEGNEGMGKTVTLKALQNKLESEHHHNVQYINCESLTESLNLEKMKTRISEWCSRIYWYKPSILLFDNADFTFTQTMNEGGKKNSVSDQISIFFINSILPMFEKSDTSIRIVFCCKNKESVNQIFFTKHFIGKIWSIKAPTKNERTILLADFIKTFPDLQIDPSIEVSDMSLETEGYSPNDLKNFVTRLYYEYQIRQNIITETILEDVIKSFTPSALQNIKLSKGQGTIKWDQIGALRVAKQVLLETLEWPTKYAPIFRKSPLRLRSGILLYGYPGCGKTLLAGAVASECGLNFISVKGPEILNKFIGASEQNIRELFERAESVKPCVLFFDEFDSIAPKRGHDSTGVTDRVVNQLLTQMDGAEGLEGVYVLAATSRPDLIDPALLRPGRLDKSILCGIPEVQERIDILTSITKKGRIQVDPNVDLFEIAEVTEGFSGADLQGLCYNAYMKSVHRRLKENEANDKKAINSSEERISSVEYKLVNKQDSYFNVEDIERLLEVNNMTDNSNTIADINETLGTQIFISHDDMRSAANEMKPSISPHELAKLRSIYDTFQGNRDGDMPQGESSLDVGTRLSLM